MKKGESVLAYIEISQGGGNLGESTLMHLCEILPMEGYSFSVEKILLVGT